MFQSLILLTKGVFEKKKRVTISYMEDFHMPWSCREVTEILLLQ